MQAPPGLSGIGLLSDRPIFSQPPPPPPRVHQQQQASSHPSQGSTQQPHYSQGSIQQPHQSPGISQQPFSEHGRVLHPSHYLTQPPFVPSQQPSMQSSPSQHGSGELQSSRVQISPARQPGQHQVLDHDAGLHTAGSSGWDHDIHRFNPEAGTLTQDQEYEAQHAQREAQSGFGRSVNGQSAQRVYQPEDQVYERFSSGSSAQHAQQASMTGLFQRVSLGNHMPQCQPSSSLQHGYGPDSETSAVHSAAEHSTQYSHPEAHRSGVTLTDRPQLGFQSQVKRRPYEHHRQPQSPSHPGDAPLGLGHMSGYMQVMHHPRDHSLHPQANDRDSPANPQGYNGPHSNPSAFAGVGSHPTSATWDAHSNTGAYNSTSRGSDQGLGDSGGSQNGTSQSEPLEDTTLPARSSSGRVLTVPRFSYTRSPANSEQTVPGGPYAAAADNGTLPNICTNTRGSSVQHYTSAASLQTRLPVRLRLHVGYASKCLWQWQH